LDNEHLQSLINNFIKDSTVESLNEEGCAVCGCLFASKELKLLSEVNNKLDILCNTEVTCKPRANVKDPVEHINGPVLASECDKICIPCLLALKKNKIPRHALANGLWIGDIPSELQDLTWMEQNS
jgi:hypothetical protein